MIAKLTEEQRQALQADPKKPLRVEDEQTRKVYLVVAEEALPTLWQDYIEREVRKGLEAAERGEVEDWDVESIKFEARQVLRQGASPAS
jgi:predicted transcriptional regulator